MCVGFFAKLILFLISLVIFLLGVAFIVVGSLLFSYPSFLENLFNQLINSNGNVEASDIVDISAVNSTAAGVLLGVGIALAILGLFGFLSSCGRKCFMFLYILVLTLLTFAEIGAIIYFGTPSAATTVNDKLGQLMYSSLNTNFEPESFDNNGVVIVTDSTSKSWIYLQNLYQCCGSYGYSDYERMAWNHVLNMGNGIVYTNATVPPSCCQMINQYELASFKGNYSNVDVCVLNKKPYLNLKGCSEEIMNSITQYAKLPILILSCASAIQLFCMTITLIIYINGNNGKSTVPI